MVADNYGRNLKIAEGRHTSIGEAEKGQGHKPAVWRRERKDAEICHLVLTVRNTVVRVACSVSVIVEVAH